MSRTPAARAAQRADGFKPLLSKKCVGRSIYPPSSSSKAVSEDAKAFAKLYSALPKGKKLGNLLVDNSKPEGPDWEVRRYEALDRLVEEGKEESAEKWKLSELWTDEKEVSERHFGVGGLGVEPCWGVEDIMRGAVGSMVEGISGYLSASTPELQSSASRSLLDMNKTVLERSHFRKRRFAFPCTQTGRHS